MSEQITSSVFSKLKATQSTAFLTRQSLFLFLFLKFITCCLLSTQEMFSELQDRNGVTDLKYSLLQIHMVKIMLNSPFAFLSKQNPYWQVFQRPSSDFQLLIHDMNSISMVILKFQFILLVVYNVVLFPLQPIFIEYISIMGIFHMRILSKQSATKQSYLVKFRVSQSK